MPNTLPGRLFHLTPVSTNRKVGPLPVSTTDRESCPDTCALKGAGCYANGGPLAMHWTAVGKPKESGGRGIAFPDFLARIRALGLGPWRHNQAGDLPADSAGRLKSRALAALADANAQGLNGDDLPEPRAGWTYTHHDPTLAGNGEAIANANARGFTVNLSGETLADADRLAALGVAPVTTLLPEGFEERTTHTPGGLRVVTCPATIPAHPKSKREPVTCANCGNGRPLCARPERPYAIGFPAHGSGKRKASALAEGASN